MAFDIDLDIRVFSCFPVKTDLTEGFVPIYSFLLCQSTCDMQGELPYAVITDEIYGISIEIDIKVSSCISNRVKCDILNLPLFLFLLRYL